MTALVLIYLTAAWAIVTGVLEIAAAVRLRRAIENEWLLGLSGAASVILCVLLLFRPAAGLLYWSWLVGIYALFFGVMLLALAFRLRAMGPERRPRRQAPA